MSEFSFTEPTWTKISEKIIAGGGHLDGAVALRSKIEWTVSVARGNPERHRLWVHRTDIVSAAAHSARTLLSQIKELEDSCDADERRTDFGLLFGFSEWLFIGDNAELDANIEATLGQLKASLSAIIQSSEARLGPVSRGRPKDVATEYLCDWVTFVLLKFAGMRARSDQGQTSSQLIDTLSLVLDAGLGAARENRNAAKAGVRRALRKFESPMIAQHLQRKKISD
jgi:hypothetical protein